MKKHKFTLLDYSPPNGYRYLKYDEIVKDGDFAFHGYNQLLAPVNNGQYSVWLNKTSKNRGLKCAYNFVRNI